MAICDCSSEAELSPTAGEVGLFLTGRQRMRQPTGYGRFARAADASAGDYIAYRGLATSKIRDWTIEDVDRLRIAREALAGFRSAVEHSRPNSRVRTLGLA
jgi:hypothetical protein